VVVETPATVVPVVLVVLVAPATVVLVVVVPATVVLVVLDTPSTVVVVAPWVVVVVAPSVVVVVDAVVLVVPSSVVLVVLAEVVVVSSTHSASLIVRTMLPGLLPTKSKSADAPWSSPVPVTEKWAAPPVIL
jgi:hypothetical protein